MNGGRRTIPQRGLRISSKVKDETKDAPDRQRIDKWLWYARMVRTRADAARLTEAGFVRLNGARMIAPGRPVRIGDVVTLALDGGVRVVEVAGFCERRGAAAQARALYRDMTRSAQ